MNMQQYLIIIVKVEKKKGGWELGVLIVALRQGIFFALFAP